MKSLYGKFIVTTLLIMIGSSVLGFYLTNAYYHKNMKASNDEKNVKIAETIVAHIEKSTQLDLSDYLATIGDIGYQIYVVDNFGYYQFFGGEYRVKTIDPTTIESVLQGEVYHGMKEFPRKTFVTGFFSNELSNTIGVPFKYENNTYALFIRPNINLLFSEVHTLLGGLIVASVLLSLLAMLLMARLIISPIIKLTTATKQIVKEKYDTQLNINRNDEIGQLATSFNTMVEHLQENDKIRNEFISNVSHDFQSPLLNIQGYAGLLKSSHTSDEEREKYLDVIQSETNRLSKLTRQLLLLTSLDKSSRLAKFNEYRLDEQLKTCINKYRWWLEEERINLSMKMEPIIYKGDEALFENVWDNLITNAIKYNEPDGEIQIELEMKEEYIQVIVQDSGIGISEAEQAQMFERFYRADSSRTTEGTGLGLSIVKQIVQLHKGEICVESIPDEGTTFIIKLPRSIS